MNERPVLAVTLGDPAGIGPEIALRLVAGEPLPARVLLVGDPAALDRERAGQAGATLPPLVAGPEALRLHDLDAGILESAARLDTLPAYGRVDAGAGAACHGWVLQAADLARAGRVDGMVTGPIHKAAWHAAGIASPGHTEALRDHAGVPRVLMLLVGGRLRVALATIHVALRTVAERLERRELTADLVLLAAQVARLFGPPRPRIAVCGLNPHAGEDGLFGDEEARIIGPAVRDACAAGVAAVGPLPADACIPAAASGAYDAVFAMYHDQGLPAVKSLAPRGAVNVTLGLPFVRTSVDHGTAFDIAGCGRATEASLRVAVEMAASMIAHAQRASHDSDASDGTATLNVARPPSDLP